MLVAFCSAVVGDAVTLPTDGAVLPRLATITAVAAPAAAPPTMPATARPDRPPPPTPPAAVVVAGVRAGALPARAAWGGSAYFVWRSAVVAVWPGRLAFPSTSQAPVRAGVSAFTV